MRELERRERWLDAGLELFGTLGFRSTSLRALSRQSGIAERYFAENFTDVEDLFVAVHQRIHDQLTDDVTRALGAAGPSVQAQARAGLGALIGGFARDPRCARIKLVESAVAGPRAEAARQAGQQLVATFLMRGLESTVRLAGLRMEVLGLGLAGAVSDLILTWHQGQLTISEQDLVEHCAMLCVAFHQGLAAHTGVMPAAPSVHAR
jgi:AcrR family transcriptional regulator